MESLFLTQRSSLPEKSLPVWDAKTGRAVQPASRVLLVMGSSSQSLGRIRTRDPWSLDSEAVLGPQMFVTQVIMNLHTDHITSASRSLLGSHRT